MALTGDSMTVEILGYLARALAAENTDKLLPFAVQNIFILVAPALFAASIYMTLGRLMRSVKGESLSIIPVRWLTRLFVLGDILSFVVQVFGGGMATSEKVDVKLAENIIIAGLVIQLVIFGMFAVTTVIFHIRVRRWPDSVAVELNPSWKRTMAMMYSVSVLIMVRSVFRVVEYIIGGNGYLLKHEWPLYVFDAALMALTMAFYGWYYPSNLRIKKGGAGDWDTVGSAPGTSSGVELKDQQMQPQATQQQHQYHIPVQQQDEHYALQPQLNQQSHHSR